MTTTSIGVVAYPPSGTALAISRQNG